MTTSTLSQTDFVEKFVDADGFRVRYLEAGDGLPLVYIHGGGGLRPSRAHSLLAETNRVIAFEVPGFGSSDENTRSTSHLDLAGSLVVAARAIGLDRFALWGSSFGAAVALWAAIGEPAAMETLILEGPGAIPPPDGFPQVRSPEEMRARLFAHPDRQPAPPPVDESVSRKQRALLQRLAAPPREEVEQHLTTLEVPTLVVFGTRDRVTPPELGRIYRDKLPRCHFVLLFDAGHEAAAERPEAFASLVQDWLTRREAFIVTQKSSLLHP